jgi:Ca-activated chloride channel family protein
MPNEGDKKVILRIVGAAVVVFLLVYAGISLIGDSGKSETLKKLDNADDSLKSIVENINVKTVTHPKVPVEIQPPGPE